MNVAETTPASRKRQARRLAVVLAGSAVALLLSSTAQSGAPPTPRLFVASPADAAGHRLQGQLLAGHVSLFLAPAQKLGRVRYVIDGKTLVPSSRSPYPRSVDVSAFATGKHTVVATYRVAGVAKQTTANFRVQTLVVSPNGNGSSGCTKRARAGLGTAPITLLDRVRSSS